MDNLLDKAKMEGIEEEAGRIVVAWESLSDALRGTLNPQEFVQRKSEGRLSAEQVKAIAQVLQTMDFVWAAANRALAKDRPWPDKSESATAKRTNRKPTTGG